MDNTRLQITIGDELARYLEIKAQMMGDKKPIGAAAVAVLTEAMLRESDQILKYLELKERTRNDNNEES